VSAWVTHLSAGIQAAADLLLAGWTMGNAIWSGRLAARRRKERRER
jgi:hypothetical protein